MSLETFKTIGAVVAFLTALFVIYDRLVRGRPIVSLTVRKEPVNPSRFLSITNVGKTDIAIRQWTVRPRLYGPAKGHSLDDIFDAVIPTKPFRCLIGPGETIELQLIPVHSGQQLEEKSDRGFWYACTGAKPLRFGYRKSRWSNSRQPKRCASL
jgi:hypothetical protein